MWVWLLTRPPDVTRDKRWRRLKLAGLYAIGALLLMFGMAVLHSR